MKTLTTVLCAVAIVGLFLVVVGLFLVVLRWPAIRAMQLSDMKEKLRIFGLLVAAHIGGVLLGTAASGLLFDMPLGKGGYLWGIIFAPLAMTIEIPMVFHCSVSVGRFVVAGLFISVACFAWGMIKYSSWALCGLFLGSILWSLGNILVFWTLMSV